MKKKFTELVTKMLLIEIVLIDYGDLKCLDFYLFYWKTFYLK